MVIHCAVLANSEFASSETVGWVGPGVVLEMCGLAGGCVRGTVNWLLKLKDDSEGGEGEWARLMRESQESGAAAE